MDLMPIYAYIYYFNILFAIIVQKGENLNVIFSFKSVFRTGLVLMIEKMAFGGHYLCLFLSAKIIPQ